MHGGGQERNRRGGTENVPAIAGFGKAAEIARKEMPEEAERLTVFRQRLIEGILGTVDGSRLNGHPEQRLPNNTNVSIDYVEGESMLLNLDLEGICASTGSACSSASLEASHVLLAMGLLHEQAHASLRFSMGKWTKQEHVDRVLEVLPAIVAKLRTMSPLLKNQR